MLKILQNIGNEYKTFLSLFHMHTQQYNVLCSSKWANREMRVWAKLAIRTCTDNVAVPLIPPFLFSSS